MPDFLLCCAFRSSHCRFFLRASVLPSAASTLPFVEAPTFVRFFTLPYFVFVTFVFLTLRIQLIFMRRSHLIFCINSCAYSNYLSFPLPDEASGRNVFNSTVCCSSVCCFSPLFYIFSFHLFFFINACAFSFYLSFLLPDEAFGRNVVNSTVCCSSVCCSLNYYMSILFVLHKCRNFFSVARFRASIVVFSARFVESFAASTLPSVEAPMLACFLTFLDWDLALS